MFVSKIISTSKPTSKKEQRQYLNVNLLVVRVCFAVCHESSTVLEFSACACGNVRGTYRSEDIFGSWFTKILNLAFYPLNSISNPFLLRAAPGDRCSLAPLAYRPAASTECNSHAATVSGHSTQLLWYPGAVRSNCGPWAQQLRVNGPKVKFGGQRG